MPLADFVWVAEQFKKYGRNNNHFFDELTFFSWYREPDFSDDYKELWDTGQNLSTVELHRGEFELASVWRLARDKDYAPWLETQGVSCVQISLFGTERNTDYFTGRKGAFKA